jgi:hypothetical protein
MALHWAIFALGALLSVAWLGFLIFGQKGASSEGNQTVEYKDFKVGLGSSVFVMSLFVVLAALPLALPHLQPPPEPKIVDCGKTPSLTPPPPADVDFHVSGTVLDCSGKVLEGARVEATDGKGIKVFEKEVEGDGNYAFSTMLRLGGSDSLTIKTLKKDYRPQQFVLYANAVNFQPVLAAGGGK